LGVPHASCAPDCGPMTCWYTGLAAPQSGPGGSGCHAQHWEHPPAAGGFHSRCPTEWRTGPTRVHRLRGRGSGKSAHAHAQVGQNLMHRPAVTATTSAMVPWLDGQYTQHAAMQVRGAMTCDCVLLTAAEQAHAQRSMGGCCPQAPPAPTCQAAKHARHCRQGDARIEGRELRVVHGERKAHLI
jgi:hypothetical protein